MGRKPRRTAAAVSLENTTALIAQLRAEGTTRAGVSDAATLLEAARAFQLREKRETYREIDRLEAEQVLTRILHLNLAYEIPMCDLGKAVELAEQFVAAALAANMKLFTNGSFGQWNPSSSWNPATDATFDTGVLAVGPAGCACVWVEDED